MIIKNISYIGLDFILTPEGRTIFIEANDHPVGLFLCPQESSTGRQRLTRSLQSFAESICQVAEGGLVCFVVPDCFLIKELDRQQSCIKLPSMLSPGYVACLKEFNEIVRLLRQSGAECIVTNAKDLEIRDNDCYFRNERIAVLFRRANYFPPAQLNCFCVNDIRARALCLDKRRTLDLLKPYITSQWLPPKISEETKFVIKKPRYGFASQFIERKSLMEARDAGWFSLNGDWLLQEWVEPSRSLHGTWEYYFDLRVFLLDGEVVSIVARHSSYPINSQVIYDTHWLTTTGRRVLVFPDEPSLRPEIPISEEAILEIKRSAEGITRILNSIIEELTITNEIKSIPSLGSIWGATKEIEIIELELGSSLEEIIAKR